MISLTQAFKLCHIRNDEIVYIVRPKDASNFPRIHTGRAVREKYDMKHTIVTGIDARFSFGEFLGMEFTIK